MSADADFLRFADKALDALAALLAQLGDEHAGRRVATPGANTPYAVVTHCLGVMEYWGGHVIHGRASHRDRDGEFRATGDVAGLLERLEAARRQLHEDVATVVLDADPAVRPELDADEAFIAATQGAVLWHVYEELSQHLGQLEVTRDVLLAQSEQG